jgi:peptide/nickel transport system substrate-binding protein
LTTIAFEVINQKQTTPNAASNDYGHSWMDAGHSAGSGPFVISSWTKGTEIILNRNDNYWGTKPALKQVILKHVASADSELILLQKNEIDVAWDLTPSQISSLSSTPGLVTSSRPQAVLYWIWMNVAQKPFDNPKVWQAVKYSIDYDGLIQTLLNGQAIKNQTLSLQGLPGYNPAAPFSKNPTMAKSLLSQAGYPNGISAQMNVSSTNSVAVLTATKIQSDMADCGINITLNNITDAEIFTNWVNGNFQMGSDWWGGGLQSIMNFVPTWIIPAAGLAAKWSSWNDPQAVGLAEQTYTAPNESAADALYQQITNYCLDNAPFVILWQMVYAIGLSSSVVGLTVPFSRLFVDFSKVYKQSVGGYTPPS